jgi:hypothetical protein
VPIPGIIGASGQSSRVYLALGIAVAGGLSAWFASHLWDSSEQVAFWLKLCGTLVGIGGLSLLWWGVRCPDCRSKWVLWAMRTQPFHSWGQALLTADSCPQCHKKVA